MKQIPTILLCIFLFYSCIPLRVAPTIKEDKVKIGKKFKRNLPRQYSFIFEDPKNANEFYNYINTKYDLNYETVEHNVPFDIDGELFFLSFYEVEIPTKTINLIPFLIDAKRQSNGNDPLFEDAHTSRIGNWYLALFVTNEAMEDCLEPNHTSRTIVLKHLRALRQEYLYTHNYVEALMRK